jgi:hypothetical protein
MLFVIDDPTNVFIQLDDFGVQRRKDDLMLLKELS